MEYNYILFAAISDALDQLELIRAKLIAAQQTAEEAYIRHPED